MEEFTGAAQEKGPPVLGITHTTVYRQKRTPGSGRGSKARASMLSAIQKKRLPAGAAGSLG